MSGSGNRAPSKIDAAIGKNISTVRKGLGLDCGTIGKAVGVSAWQFSKYEAGVTRISASRLVLCSRALKVPISRFYRGIEVHHG
jgi:ribosomal protein L18E